MLDRCLLGRSDMQKDCVVDPRHALGDLCEAIAVKEFTRLGFTVFTTTQAHSPVDIVCVDRAGELYLFDCKANASRVSPGRKTPSRIHRKRTDEQKRLGVRMCYVDEAAEKIHIVPALETDKECKTS